jgi:hypothetical protein
MGLVVRALPDGRLCCRGGRTTTSYMALMVAVAVVWSATIASMVASAVAATVRLLAVAALDLAAGQVAQVTNRPGGMPPDTPLLQ